MSAGLYKIINKDVVHVVSCKHYKNAYFRLPNNIRLDYLTRHYIHSDYVLERRII